MFYKNYRVNNQNLPDNPDITCFDIKDKTDFINFITSEIWVQHFLGIRIESVSSVFIFGETNKPIKVDFEYNAEDFKEDSHYDLIISFIRKRREIFINGIPVWSFYLKSDYTESYRLTIFSDLRTDYKSISFLFH